MNTDHANATFSKFTPGVLERQARDLLRDFATGRPTTSDIEIIRRWRAQSAAHEKAWVAACSEWKKIGTAARAFDARFPAAAGARPARASRRAFFGAALSAVGALGAVALVRPPLGLWPSWSEMGADYRTAIGEQREIALNAGTHVLLNTRTSIAVQQHNGQSRIELIAGEAALSVWGERACELMAGNGFVDVAGGEVNVYRLDATRVRVYCTAGSARLRHPDGDRVLQAGQRVFYDGQSVEQVTQSSGQASTWREGVVTFKDMPLGDVVDEINRYRPGRVVLLSSALARRRLSARFYIASLDEAITHIEQMYQATVRRVGDVVFIT
ncbi:putative FecR [Pusillimonas sp. T7-7]|uniref:FecR family protein n=1 Tax=Pusillimonas sp. (strain T7-7) TaxID=1007105 RepID=UPI0002084AFD|nr:FecR domain-containing protein [Pusillimonas sp. T7-7]AEC18825.1 putative FecR [Pusillimonas sp. T7-7]